ncbi:YbaB/EbfC family DNA-binding protein [Mycolicibacterium fortuitum]|uniref:YbaB/EbfC family DNA-binding protein n=1 Tax=Mycolicibacterium fortuitum TaxID=1766 RepID=UPI000AAF5AD4|nr:YbaB/EbfC family DNA-binding protein [Mycolicibacterium fortuitum]NOR03770.1 YbaB/EbfC family DNA-binding protein [Mycolicibacterium fortuitum]UBV23171.1 YbaB/EbfC family DNA-binding protein [Mycolicibacterium fortuitum]
MGNEWAPSGGDWDDDDEVDVDNSMQLDGLPDYDDYSPTDDGNHDNWIVESHDARQSSTAEDDSTVETLIVTARNPGGSVTATATIDGRVFQLDLAPLVTRMTEPELAAEIVKVCGLATKQAEAAQYYLVANLMDELGQDPAGTRAFLEHTIGLPTPETVLNEKAQMFADHYADPDWRD